MKDVDSKAHWNLKYEQGLPSLTKPDPFFLSAYGRFVHPSFPDAGVALDVAGGLGRHALWLASRAWRVNVVDVSSVAIEKLSQSAGQLGLKLGLHLGDASDYDFGVGRFDLIILFYHLDRSLFPRIVSALKPAGLVICKMAMSWGSEVAAATTDAKLLRRGELVSLFPGFCVMNHGERPARERGVVELVARKLRPEATTRSKGT
jgi:2-polyprenyl-3-methyl-5-hydroxy-6-metoxy-1,4-benzoquinol methylase